MSDQSLPGLAERQGEEVTRMRSRPREEGQTPVEYALILVLIVVVVLLVWIVVWPAIETVLSEIGLFSEYFGTPTPP
jgi:Flp pilus assembly pilin Flp